MEATKITKDKIISLIKEEKEVILRKKEIYEELMKLNSELKTISESKGIAGTFGFKGDMGDKNANLSGFEETPNISYIAQLEKEMGLDREDSLNEDELNEVSKLKEENKNLKEQLDSIQETLKTITNPANTETGDSDIKN